VVPFPSALRGKPYEGHSYLIGLVAMTTCRMHVFPVVLPVQRPLSRVLKHMIAAGARPTKGHCGVTTLEEGVKKRTGGARNACGCCLDRITSNELSELSASQ
jgi:hypothetical protein